MRSPKETYPSAFQKREAKTILPNDIARCDGSRPEGFWREGCKACLRRISPRPEYPIMILPPSIIAFECGYLIESSPSDVIAICHDALSDIASQYAGYPDEVLAEIAPEWLGKVRNALDAITETTTKL